MASLVPPATARRCSCTRQALHHLFSYSRPVYTKATQPSKKTKTARTREGPSPRSSAALKEYWASQAGGIELPPANQWKNYFGYPGKKAAGRLAVHNPDTARLLADLIVPKGSRDRVVIDAYPGPGVLTRTMLELPKSRLKKLIVLEDASEYVACLEPLVNHDPRLVFYRDDPSSWKLYQKLQEEGHLSKPETSSDTPSWDTGHPQLSFVMHMGPKNEYEKLVSQFIRTIPERQWLFRYGRVPLHLFVPENVYQRLVAQPGAKERCKLSVIAQATIDIEDLLPPESMQPRKDHFWPLRDTYDLVALTLTPKLKQVIQPGDLEIWDYVLRKMFARRTQPIHNSILNLGPGAKNLLTNLGDVGVDAVVQDLTVQGWGRIVEEFKKWPFRPMDIMYFTYTEHKRDT